MLGHEQVIATFEKVGAMIKDSHLVYTSGKHGSTYINKDALYPHTQVTSVLCWSLAEATGDLNVDIVVGPALGGIILSQWVAHHLSEISQREVLGVYAEKLADGNFVLKRGYENMVGQKRVLVVEDVLNTGISVKRLVSTLQGYGAEVVAVAALCNRGGVTPVDVGGVPKLISLLNLELEAWEPQECPLCKKGVPINTSLGKGKSPSV